VQISRNEAVNGLQVKVFQTRRLEASEGSGWAWGCDGGSCCAWHSQPLLPLLGKLGQCGSSAGSHPASSPGARQALFWRVFFSYCTVIYCLDMLV